MSASRTRKTRSLASKTTQMAFAVPQVVAHRMARMAMAGPNLSARDRKEFQRMGSEKTAAFTQSWNAMAVQALRANQAAATSFLSAFWAPSGWRPPTAAGVAAQMHDATVAMLGVALAPVHRTAMANAKRLIGTRR